MRPQNNNFGQTPATEIHLSARQIAALWGVDVKTVYKEFRDEPGVVRLTGATRESIRVPGSVVERVHARLSSVA